MSCLMNLAGDFKREIIMKEKTERLRVLKVVICSICIFTSSLFATGVYFDFDDFPVTGELEIPSGGASGWTYSSVKTDTGHTFYGGSGFWRGDINQIHDYFQLSNLSGSSFNNPHMGWTTFNYFEIDNQVAVRGNSFKITVTGGRYGETPDEYGDNSILYGLPVTSKEDYLDHINAGNDPVSSERRIGHPVVYFLRHNLGFDEPFEQAAGANRMSFYAYLPAGVDNMHHTGRTVRPPLGTGPFSEITNSTIFPPSHPDYNPDPSVTMGGHWYDSFYTRGGGWTHFQSDGHPQHNNGFSNAARYPYPSRSVRNLGVEYFSTMFRNYITVAPYSGISTPKYNIWLDEKVFWHDAEPQNGETINNISILFRDSIKEFEIGFNDKYKPGGGRGFATYEVRYSFAPITNANWNSATKVHMLGDPRFNNIHSNIDGIMRKVSSYGTPIWAPFKLANSTDENLLTPGNTIYFAVKDVSQDPNNIRLPREAGWGRDYINDADKFDFAGDEAALPLIKRIDYFISEKPTILEVRTTRLIDAHIGVNYHKTLQAVSGVAPYTWQTSSTLPSGITLNQNGQLSGIPTTAGTYVLNLEVADSSTNPKIGSRKITLNVQNQEICNDDIDNDNDGRIDCHDTNCENSASCLVTTLVDFGDSAANNIFETNWTEVIKTSAAGYSDIGPDGMTTLIGTNGKSNFQGVRGVDKTFQTGDVVRVYWYNNFNNTISFVPKISFTDENSYSTVDADAWYRLDSAKIEEKTINSTDYIVDVNSSGTHNLVNMNVNSWKTRDIILDKILLVQKNTGPQIIRANVDQQNGINSTDAMLTLRNSLSFDMSTTNWQSSTTTGDVNCDGTTNSADAVLILRYSLGLDMSGTGWCE